MAGPCPVCGKADGSCGDQPLAFPPIVAFGEGGSVVADKDGKVYMPKQTTRRGVAGYRGNNIIVVDAKGKPDPSAVKPLSTGGKNR